MEQTLEDTATQLIVRLTNELTQEEDAEGAIRLYKTVNWIIGQLEQVKDLALNVAEQDMQERGLEALKTPVGSAGWTEPKVKQLNEQAWREALARDAHLMTIQQRFELAETALQHAQEPFRELPKSTFFIR